MTKRVKLAADGNRREYKEEEEEEEEGISNLIPGLPDDVALLCLSKIRPSLLYCVCSSWRRLIYSPLFPPFLSLYTLCVPTCSNLNSITPTATNAIQLMNFDPISSQWISIPLPSAPEPPIRLLLRHPSFLSRNLPIQSVAAADSLILLAATTQRLLPALPRPLVFTPLSSSSSKWSHGSPIAVPRRWCAAGALGRTVFLASGIGSHFSSDVARSFEKWEFPKNADNTTKSSNRNIGTGKWEKLGSLKDGRFCREAIDAVGWRGKLCMVNVKGNAAKEGAVYDVGHDRWEEMPERMIAGWRGPAAAMEEDVIYVVDESKGVLRRYDDENDGWVDVLESERLRKAQHIAAARGRVCVVVGGGESGGVVMVDVVASPPRLWVVDMPPGLEAVAVHILPRMNKP
ncbi:hypothetical protein Nepgr_010981 [Nepenthes gracilis]|uniref:F-box/kelch-repeat protein SKIP25 n=1 Tax=Nepenthes gracilis TaxID=150966 RepID=A0AAD3SE83_NEPGR|nr:hypothetical protein Nepgr_010981 [Nepenthes gracilis]